MNERNKAKLLIPHYEVLTPVPQACRKAHVLRQGFPGFIEGLTART
jgi:hypothetical protein